MKIVIAMIVTFAVAVTTFALIRPTSEILTPSVTNNVITTQSNNVETNKVPVNVKRIKVNDNDIITLFGEVDEVSALVLIKAINEHQNSKELFLLLDSPGGSVFAGLTIITAMEASKVPINTVVTGLCASMCAMIHQHGVKRLMFDRATLMFHPASGGLGGTLEQMETRVNYISNVVKKMNERVAERSGLTFDEFKKMYLVEKWIDARDAVRDKFADGLVYIPMQIKIEGFVPEEHLKKMNIELK